MFEQATAFNEPIGDWNTASVSGTRIRRRSSAYGDVRVHAASRMESIASGSAPIGSGRIRSHRDRRACVCRVSWPRIQPRSFVRACVRQQGSPR